MIIKLEDGTEVELASGEVLTAEGQILSPEEVDAKYTRKGRHEDGREYPNPVPVAPPIGFVPTEPVHELIARLVQDGIRRQREIETGEELETAEEADDFDVGDDFDPQAPYEHDFEPTLPWPASRAVRELELQINEARNAGRIAGLREELEALSNGRPWPPVAPNSSPPPPPVPSGRNSPRPAKLRSVATYVPELSRRECSGPRPTPSARFRRNRASLYQHPITSQGTAEPLPLR